MTKYARRLPPPPKASSRRGLSSGLCIFLLIAGAVFWLALPGGLHWGINLQVVGIIILCAGLVGLVLPRLPGMPARTDRLRRWVIPSGTTGVGAGPAGGYWNGYDDDQSTADAVRQHDLLNVEKDPPL